MKLEKALERTDLVNIYGFGGMKQLANDGYKRLWTFRKDKPGIWWWSHNHVSQTILEKGVIDHIRYHAAKEGHDVYLHRSDGSVLLCEELKELAERTTHHDLSPNSQL